MGRVAAPLKLKTFNDSPYNMNSILQEGFNMLSALDHLEKDIRDIAKVYTNTHRWEDVENLCQGDLVRKGFKIGIIVRQKASEQNGLVAFLNTSEHKWYYVLSYCPYIHDIGYDGSCGLVTNAICKDDGLVNTKIIEEFAENYRASIKNNSIYGCPADEHYFPAFDYCRDSELNTYLPAIQELLLLANNRELFQYYLQVNKDLNNVNMLEGKTCRIWSSTDAQQSYTIEDDGGKRYSNAFAVLLYSNGKTGIISTAKTEEAWCIPFCRF